MKIKFLITAAMMFAAVMLSAQNRFSNSQKKINDDFQKFKQAQHAGFDTYAKNITDEYDKYVEKINKEYQSFVKSIESQWGKGNATMSDKKSWVEYSDDKKSRTTVDFESGKAEVEVVLSDSELANPSLVKEKLEESVEQLLSSKGKTVEYNSDYIPKKPLSDDVIMNNLIDSKKYSNQTASKEIAKAIVENESVKVTKVTNEQGNVNVVTITPDMVGDYIYKLAKRYEPMVIAASKRFSIDRSLIFAIFETESSFNPAAASHIPAYGLMQIVPKYAGRDAYKYLYGQDKLLNQTYLYQPDKNIEMGVGYLNLLETRYFKTVKDKQSRELCMIAAYNTGAGNVSRAMAGHTNVFKTIPQINSMNYNQLYNHFRYKLPFDETRKYIQKVTSKREKYQ